MIHIRINTITVFPILIIFSFAFSCSTLEKSKKERAVWTIGQFNINTSWNDQDRKYPLVFSSMPAQSPVKYILRPLPSVGNQGAQASGTAWTVALASSYMFHVKRNIQGYYCSPSFLYNTLNQGQDAGIDLHKALNLFVGTGCPREQLMKYNPNDYTAQPSPEILKNAMNYKLAGFGRVDFSDINQVKGHLLQNSVVMTTMEVFENFLDLSTDVWKIPAGARIGRHSICVVGYDDQKKAFLIQNSAGTDWGQKGMAWIPYDWFIRLTVSAYVLW